MCLLSLKSGCGVCVLENGELEGRGIYFACIGLTFLFLEDMVALKRAV